MCIMCFCVALLSLWHQSILACEGSSPTTTGPRQHCTAAGYLYLRASLMFLFLPLWPVLLFSTLFSVLIAMRAACRGFLMFLGSFRFSNQVTIHVLGFVDLQHASTFSLLRLVAFSVASFCRTARALISSCRKVDGPSWAHLAGDALIGEPPRR